MKEEVKHGRVHRVRNMRCIKSATSEAATESRTPTAAEPNRLLTVCPTELSKTDFNSQKFTVSEVSWKLHLQEKKEGANR